MHSPDIAHHTLFLILLLGNLVWGNLICIKCRKGQLTLVAEPQLSTCKYWCGSLRRKNDCKVDIECKQHVCNNPKCYAVAMVPSVEHCNGKNESHNIQAYYYQPIPGRSN
ncbi:hypothetical protein PGT21_024754 [Puccinia graminis f. sp. tritici]|uniref:Uncharacterized protein n=1 Tax=Puccinia graminis f. sp. tritici TaxID=56615 RepID=A0A5B0LKE9_PUCGR|nr:hypothetical protein PGT21_024754 [Puccinia graminis f. sp. tritici]KAA1112506.1 hypothetical protein PGTUg99_021759 [Puccinia graminis f. sp. tritici]